MTRRHWTEMELSAIESGLPWSIFHRFHPERTYDSWEVKRRRVAGGSAGTNKRQIAAHRKTAARAERALRIIADILGVDLRD